MAYNTYPCANPTKTVKKAVRNGLAAVAMISAGMPLNTANAKAAVPVPKSVKSGLYAVGNLKKGQRLRVLDGKTEHLRVKPGALVFETTAKGIKKVALKSSLDVLHGSAKTGDQPLAFFKSGDQAVCLPLNTKFNQSHITEVTASGTQKLFRLDDVAVKTVTLDLIQNGFAFAQMPHDALQGSIGGKPEVPIAQSAD